MKLSEGDVIEVHVRDVDWRKRLAPHWERATFAYITNAGSICVRMENGNFKAFALDDVRRAEGNER